MDRDWGKALGPTETLVGYLECCRRHCSKILRGEKKQMSFCTLAFRVIGT